MNTATRFAENSIAADKVGALEWIIQSETTKVLVRRFTKKGNSSPAWKTAGSKEQSQWQQFFLTNQKQRRNES